MGEEVVLLVVGMAGSGKTTLTKSLSSYLESHGRRPFIVNLDPAVLGTPYVSDVDIKRTIDYDSIQEKYGLGPNGAIVTALNLFAVNFVDVLGSLEVFYADAGEAKTKSAIFDTPGQIEIFTWSASGSIIAEALSSKYKTLIIYVLDTNCCKSPETFISNMLYSCSILYRMQLPLVVVFNKIDKADPDFIYEWIGDYETLQKAIFEKDSYMSSLTNSMCLILEEFYKHLDIVAVSAVTGKNFDKLVAAIGSSLEKCPRRPVKDGKKNMSDEELAMFMKDVLLEGKNK